MSDTFNLSGDFKGAILNIKSTLQDVQQSVGDLQSTDQELKNELRTIIAQLSKELEKVPPEKKEQAEAVAQTAKVLVDQAKAEKPNHAMLQITGEGLKQAAKNLADVLPTVVSMAAQVVIIIGQLAGGLK